MEDRKAHVTVKIGFVIVKYVLIIDGQIIIKDGGKKNNDTGNFCCIEVLSR